MDAAARITALAPHTPVSAAGDACVSPAFRGLSIQVRRLALAPRPSSGVGRLDLDIGAGELLVVSGRSGSGKTTLLRVLAGELTPTMGSALIGGHPPHAYAPGEIVFVARDDHLFTGSVRDNMRPADPAVSAQRIEEILLATGLTHRGIDAATRWAWAAVRCPAVNAAGCASPEPSSRTRACSSSTSRPKASTGQLPASCCDGYASRCRPPRSSLQSTTVTSMGSCRTSSRVCRSTR